MKHKQIFAVECAAEIHAGLDLKPDNTLALAAEIAELMALRQDYEKKLSAAEQQRDILAEALQRVDIAEWLDLLLRHEVLRDCPTYPQQEWPTCRHDLAVGACPICFSEDQMDAICGAAFEKEIAAPVSAEAAPVDRTPAPKSQDGFTSQRKCICCGEPSLSESYPFCFVCHAAGCEAESTHKRTKKFCPATTLRAKP